MTELQQQLQQERQQRHQLEQQMVGCVPRGPRQEAAVQASEAMVSCSVQTGVPEEDERQHSQWHAGRCHACGFRDKPASVLTNLQTDVPQEDMTGQVSEVLSTQHIASCQHSRLSA